MPDVRLPNAIPRQPPPAATGDPSGFRLRRRGLWALGFRPFFLAAGALAVVSMALWLALLFGWVAQPAYLAGTNWHAHEMLFGYTTAVIAGFLLTAARNWSGLPTAGGALLAALVGLWLAGRIAPWLAAPAWLVGLLDIAFFPALALSLWRPLWQGPNPTNRLFLAVFAGFTLASLLVNLQGMGFAAEPGWGLAARGQRLMLDLVLVVILLVGGRVLPFFTRAALPDAKPLTWRWLDTLTFGAALAMLVLHQAQVGTAPPGEWAGRLAGVAAIATGALQLVRLAGWHDRRAWRLPMLTVLYLGFLWLAAGLLLDGVAAFGLLPPSIAVHALTAGAIGVLTLGMMARVTLGHTGRAMQANRSTLAAFVLVNVAALLRTAAVWAVPQLYLIWMIAAGLCWIAAFALFTSVYAPMLVAPRVDGKQG
jgi:uncharacterized protein involved in response to NO